VDQKIRTIISDGVGADKPRIPRKIQYNVRMLSGRILAVDYGTKNVGLACSDDLGVTVRPLPSVPNNGRRDLILRLKVVASAQRASGVVIGLPWNMDGSGGDAVSKTERFADSLRSALELPLEAVDERLSTVEALEIWSGMSPRQKHRYRTVDSVAAALILRRYLEESK
jgi:putative Holliday junction resolvase